LPLAAIFGFFAAAAPLVSNRSSRPELEEWWVDGSSAPGGSGTAERPFKSLDAALARAGHSPARIHLAAGLYRGPFHPAGSTEMLGYGAVVLFDEGSGVVLTPQGSLELKNVIIQGGEVGIQSAVELRLSGVSFSGQRKLGVRLRSGRLLANGVVFSAGVSEATAVRIEASARAELNRCTFQGPYRRALELIAPARVEVTDCAFDGPVTGLHQIGGSAAVRRTRFSGGRGPAVFCAQGNLELLDVDVFGHEYALQGGEGSTVHVLRFSSVGAERAGIALTRATAHLEEVTTIDSGSFGAVQLVGSNVVLRRFRFQHPEAYGLSGRQSTVSVSDGAISDVTDHGGSAGDGIQLRQCRGSIESVSILRTAGAGLLAAEDSSLTLRDFSVDRCHWGGVIAETLARVQGSSWTIRNCDAPAVAVPEAAQIDVEVLRSEHNAQGLFWVEPARGGKLRVWCATEDGSRASPSPCADLAR
jgi:hypothetical protein